MKYTYGCSHVAKDGLIIDTNVPLTGNISLKIHEHKVTAEVILNTNSIIKLHNDIKDIMVNRLLKIKE